MPEDLSERPSFEDVAETLSEPLRRYLERMTGNPATADDLREFARERMAHFKVPTRWQFVSEFPMTVTGKIRKFRIRELIAAEAARA